MPSVRTMISDLYHNRMQGVGGMGVWGARGSSEEKIFSGAYRVKSSSRPITVSVGDAPANRLAMDDAPTDGNGRYLFFDDDSSCTGLLTRTHRIVVGGGYSGCLYSVYDVGGGEYQCVHTPRPNTAKKEDFVMALRAYAKDKGWVLIHEVPTVADAQGGVGVNGCVTTFLATRVSYTVAPTPMVRTVRLRLNSMGLSVGRDRWETPT